MLHLSILHDLRISAILLSSVYFLRTAAFDNTRYDNVAVYWGQNSYGAANAGDTANYQKTLAYYCADDAIDVIPLAFVNIFFGTGGAPSMDLANTCNPTDNTTFSGTALPECTSLATDITTCQSKGKIITLSLGGATGSVGFTGDAQAETFAQTIWDDYFEGTSSTRPFGSAVLDGIDLDIESGSSSYTAFLTKFRSLASGGSKKYYVSGAPQCVFPDAALGATLNVADFDMVYVQFYNNQCGLQNFALAQDWDFGLWDNWARNTSTNPNVKVYIGAPASSTAAGGGYQDISALSSIAKQMRDSFPSFGGVMLWDASQAYANGRYDLGIKNALVAAGGTGFPYPACSAPAYVAGQDYTGGSQVSYGGYIWQAKFWASGTPVNTPNGDWSAISACGGASSPPSSTVSTKTSATSTSSTASKTTSSSASPSSTSSGNCVGIAAWSSSIAYTAGMQITYSNELWVAKQWTEADVPGGASGSWTNEGPCASTKRAIAGRQCQIILKPTSTPQSKRRISRLFRGI